MKRFAELAEIDSESYSEGQIGGKVAERLRELGLEVTAEGTDEAFLKAHPGSCPNIFATLKGNVPR